MLPFIRLLARLLLRGQPLPRHVAFIMDGNRRFADQLSRKRIDGHKLGYNKMKDIIQWCLELGIKCVSVYAFSIENFKRPKDEVDSLMELAGLKFEELCCDEDAKRWGAELRVIGDLSRAPPFAQAAAAKLMQGSKELGPHKAVVNICFSYTSTQELQQSVQHVCNGIQNCELLPDDINPELLHRTMHTQDCPPVDLLVRTSGEQRLSDFLLWQSSHAMLQWETCLWPEFGYAQLLRALLAWQQAAPQLQQLRAAAAETVDAELQLQLQHAAACNGAASPPRCAWAGAAAQDAEVQEQLRQSSLLLQQQLQQQKQQQQQQQWWGSWLTGRSSRSGGGGSSAASSMQQQSPAGRSPERASSMCLSAISEDEATHCPHPSQQLRTDSFLQRIGQEYANNIQQLAAS